MKSLVVNHKFLVSFAVLSILAVGCSKQPASEKLTNNNKGSEIITSKEKVEQDTSTKINSGLLIGLSKNNEIDTKLNSMGDPYKLQTQWLYYVGNNYASIMTNYYDTGGGTYKSSYDDFKMYEIGTLSNLNELDNSVTLFDMLDESEQLKLKGYSQKYDKNISSDGYITVDQLVDSKNLQSDRKDGEWQVSIPLFNVYQHSGNGSNGRTVERYINTDIKLPAKITSYDSLCMDWDEIKKKISEAKDAVSSPNNDMLALLTPTELLVFTNPKLGIDKPSLSIDVDENESIILNQWATGEYVDKWSKLISDY